MYERLSVVLPTRNEVDRIDGFLASLPDTIELVVVDASDDGTPDLIAQRRPANTQIIRSPARIAGARQLGARAARGEWLLFSDADVAFEPGYFDRIERYTRFDAFYGPKYATAQHPTYSMCFNTGQRICQALGVPAASGSNMAVRRDVFEAAGGFRCDLPVNEDTELFLRLAFLGYRISYAFELGVRSLDDRRLDRGSIRKMWHSVARGMLLLANLYLPLPQRWLRHDWGYWRRARGRS